MSKGILYAAIEPLTSLINEHIARELYASQVYLSLYSHYAHDKVALPGLAKFYLLSCHEEREHAQKLIDYTIKRGVQVEIKAIEKPPAVGAGCPLEVLKSVVSLENQVTESIVTLTRAAEKANDHDFSDYLVTEYIREQNEGIQKLSAIHTQLERACQGGELGLFLWDQQFLKSLE